MWRPALDPPRRLSSTVIEEVPAQGMATSSIIHEPRDIHESLLTMSPRSESICTVVKCSTIERWGGLGRFASIGGHRDIRVD